MFTFLDDGNKRFPKILDFYSELIQLVTKAEFQTVTQTSAIWLILTTTLQKVSNYTAVLSDKMVMKNMGSYRQCCWK
jgi:hypothetical protein